MMKKILPHLGALLLFILLPMLAIPAQDGGGAAEEVKTEEKESRPFQGITLFDVSTGETLQIQEREFLIGAIASEMPMSFHDEALKAQGIAALTYYRRLSEDGGAVSVDTQRLYIYADEAALRRKWGEDYDRYYARLSRIASEIEGKILTENGEPITACYYAISSGNTESSADIWGGEKAYLSALASPWDQYVPGFASRADYSLEEAASVLYVLTGERFSAGMPFFLDCVRSASGAVLSVQTQAGELSGGTLRKAFDLRSQNFTWEQTEERLSFRVKGWGHGVGMSQAGADYLAGQGWKCEEILSYYYPGAVLSEEK